MLDVMRASARPLMGLLLAAMIVAPAATLAASRPPTMEGRTASPLHLAERLADWQLAHLDDATLVTRFSDDTLDRRGWVQATFWIGMTALADHQPVGSRFARAIHDMGARNGWTLGERSYHADDQAIAQVYLWSARHGAGQQATLPVRRSLNAILAAPPRVGLGFYKAPDGKSAIECQTRWCWSDALFMAPAGWIELSHQSRDQRYRRYALSEFWATVAFLYDPAERLFYRDSRFFERRDATGGKQFWSRGNGWVFASMARIIPLLPPQDPDRRRMEALFREMATRLVDLQKPDGTWAPSLLAPTGSPTETSGTAFFTYGIAWGVKTGLLERGRFEQAARRGWSALASAIQPDGRLGFVQQVSDRPDRVAATDTQFYGVGAFILAATAMADLDRTRQNHAN